MASKDVRKFYGDLLRKAEDVLAGNPSDDPNVTPSNARKVANMAYYMMTSIRPDEDELKDITRQGWIDMIKEALKGDKE